MSGLYSKKRIVSFIIVSSIVLSALLGVKLLISYYSIGKSAQTTLAKQYIEIAKDIAEGLDKDVYQKFLTSKQDDENRKQIKQYLEEYHKRINAIYVYVLMLDESDISKVMVSAYHPNMDGFPIGFPCTVPVTQVRQAKSGQSYFTNIIEDEISGNYLSVGVPFSNADGQILGVIGIDIGVEELEHLSNQVLKSNFFIFGIDIVFAIVLLIVAFSLYQWYKLRMKQDLKESEKMYISELRRVTDAIKSSRHDMINHLQVLSGLMEMKLHDKASDYLKELAIESKMVDLSLRIQNPILMVVFQSKREFAESKGIPMHFETDQNEYSRVESMDLARIYSNLLDNAIEATGAYCGDQPKEIRVICKSIGDKYIFVVENTAELTEIEQKSIFQNGYTTKENKNELNGHGLMIIKRTVDVYKGEIYFGYKEEKVTIQITI